MATVDPKAVLEGRTPGRAPVGVIIGIVIACVCAILALGLDLVLGSTVPFVVGLLLAVIPVPLLVAVVLLLDRLEPEPWLNLVFARRWVR